MIRFLWILILAPMSLWGQNWSVSAGHAYLNASEWDKAVRIYNFSRPFLEEKQPLFGHGAAIGGRFLPFETRDFKMGPAIFVSRFQSYAENPNLEVGLNATLANVVFVFRHEWPTSDSANKVKTWFAQLSGGVVLATLGKNGNEEAFFQEEATLRHYGLGPSLNLGAGKQLFAIKENMLGLEIGIHTSPFLWVNDAEKLLNQSSTLLVSATGAIQFSTSIFYSW